MRNLELEERIRAAPADLDAYDVYADWLLERGVSHGELIAFAVRRRRAGDEVTADFATLAAEGRLLRDRAQMFGEALGALPREVVELDLELGFFTAVRLYTRGDNAGRALRAVLTERAGALVREVSVVQKSLLRDPFVAEDRKTAKAVWAVLEEVGLPRTLDEVALPLVADATASQFDVLARVPRCTFSLRSVATVAEHCYRLGALESLTLTTNRYLDELAVDAVRASAPGLAAVPHIILRTQFAPAPARAALLEALPQLTFG